MLVLLAAVTLLQTIVLEGDTGHVQGIVVAESRLWVTSVDRAARKGYLLAFELPSGRRLRRFEIQDGAAYHPGGFDADGSSFWIPVAEYRPLSRTVIQRRDRNTGELLSSFAVPDHIGCLTLIADTLIAANWDARKFYRYTLGGELLEARDNPNATRYQELKFRGGLLVASGLHPRGLAGGAVEWLDAKTLALLRREGFAVTDRGVPFNNEGMDLREDLLYLLPEDAPSRLFVYRVTPLQ